MKLDKYLVHTVNNQEPGRGQRSVVWLKRARPSYHLHVLSTGFPGGHSLRLAFGSFFYLNFPD